MEEGMDMTASTHGAIACIGWGSLVHDWRDLPCKKWHSDGPLLPVEFARQSRDGRITLVICPGVTCLPTFWSVLDVPDLQTAKERLGMREYADAGPKWVAKNIGFWDRASATSHGLESDTIATWAALRGFASVVWTNLPPKFNGQDGVMPDEDAVVAYLRALEGTARGLAEDYVRKAPAQIDTAYRQRIARDLGWTCLP